MQTELNEQQVRERLRAAVDAAGGQYAFARMVGTTPRYVDHLLKGQRPVRGRALEVLGLQYVGVYRELKP